MKGKVGILGPLEHAQQVRFEHLLSHGKLPPRLEILLPRTPPPAAGCSPEEWLGYCAGVTGVEVVARAEAFDPLLEPYEAAVINALHGRSTLLSLLQPNGILPLVTNRWKRPPLKSGTSWSALVETHGPEILSEIGFLTTAENRSEQASVSALHLSAHLTTGFAAMLRHGGDFDVLRSSAATLLLAARDALWARHREPGHEARRTVVVAHALAMAREFTGLDQLRWLDIRLRKKRRILNEAFADFEPHLSHVVLYGAGTHSQILLQVLKDYGFPHPEHIVTTSAPPAATMLGIPASRIEEFHPSKPRTVFLISSISYEDAMAKNARRLFPDARIVCFWRGRQTHLLKPSQ